MSATHPDRDPSRIRFALHGGAGDPPADAGSQDQQHAALHRIATEALHLLRQGASALDAVSRAVVLLEECPLFNAGVGAVLNRDGQPELDASIMDGSNRAAGAVAGVSRVKSPVLLARAIMQRTAYVCFAGAGAESQARGLGLELVEPSYFITEPRLRQLEAARRAGVVTLDHDHAFGTVGAVARDAAGHLAAATSTGGLTNKPPGRIGDTPVIGAGTFADDASLALSCTGTGEAFLRACFGASAHARLAWCGWDLERACAEGLATVHGYGGRGGCIAVDREGNLSLPFNAGSMFRAWAGADGVVHAASARPEN
jgi:beta-aspartyl-peptidase (threonine type)